MCYNKKYINEQILFSYKEKTNQRLYSIEKKSTCTVQLIKGIKISILNLNSNNNKFNLFYSTYIFC